MSVTGTFSNIVLYDVCGEKRDQWLISYGDDPDVGLLWHEIRLLNEEERKALGDKLQLFSPATSLRRR